MVHSPGKAFLLSCLHPSHCGRPFHAGHRDESGGRGPGPSEAVGTVSVSPSTSPPNFPLGSRETEVKVAAGALGGGSAREPLGEQCRQGPGPAAAASGWTDDG